MKHYIETGRTRCLLNFVTGFSRPCSSPCHYPNSDLGVVVILSLFKFAHRWEMVVALNLARVRKCAGKNRRYSIIALQLSHLLKAARASSSTSLVSVCHVDILPPALEQKVRSSE